MITESPLRAVVGVGGISKYVTERKERGWNCPTEKREAFLLVSGLCHGNNLMPQIGGMRSSSEQTSAWQSLPEDAKYLEGK